MPTINDLRQQAATIKNATQVGENTATRVGTTFETIADLLEQQGVGQGVPSVDLSQLNTLRTPADQTTANPTIYNVTTLHNLSSTTIKVGTLFIFSDGGRAVVTQILLSNYQVDGGGNISSPNTSQITMYYRMFNIVQETWSAWTLYAGGGGGGTIDPHPVSGSDNAVASNGVFEGLQKAAPEVDINDIDDLDDYVNMQTGEASTYTIKAYHNLSSTWLRVGVLMVFANQANNTLTQICISNCMVDGGGNLIPNYTTNVMNVFYRFKQFSGNPPEGMTIGVWTTWAKFGDSGYQPDNEDINLNANDQLQFANKAYDASAFSGLGRVYLRKNIVTSGGVEKNVLTQAIMNTANTIYHIQYDYDLNGQTITLPAGCVLEFDGGSVKDGTLIGNGTRIAYDGVVFDNVSISGTWNVPEIRSTMFSGLTNNGLKNLFALANSSQYNKIIVEDGTYNVIAEDAVGAYALKVESNTDVVINGEIHLTPFYGASGLTYGYYVLLCNGDNIKVIGSGTLFGDKETSTSKSTEFGHGVLIHGNNVSVQGIKVQDCYGDGMAVTIEAGVVTIDGVEIENFYRNGVSVVGGDKVTICNAYIHDGGETSPRAAIDVEPNATYSVGDVIMENITIENTPTGLQLLSSASGASIGNVYVNNVNTSGNWKALTASCDNRCKSLMLRNFVANNDVEPTTTGVTVYYFTIVGIDNVTMENCSISKSIINSSPAIYIASIKGCTISSCHLEYYGTYLFATVDNTLIRNCDIICWQIATALRHSVIENNNINGTIYANVFTDTIVRNNNIFVNGRDSSFNFTAMIDVHEGGGADGGNAIVGNAINMDFTSFNSSLKKTAIAVKTSNNIISDNTIDNAGGGVASTGAILINAVAENNVIKRNKYDNFAASVRKVVDNNGKNIYDVLAPNVGTYDNKPSLQNSYYDNANVGHIYFDKTNNRPIFWNGTKYVDAMGGNVVLENLDVVGTFIKRTTANGAAISLNEATILNIKGNSLKWNQIANPTLNTSTIKGVDCTKNEDGSYTFNGTNDGSGSSIFVLQTGITPVGGHKYFFKKGDICSYGTYFLNFSSTYFGGTEISAGEEVIIEATASGTCQMQFLVWSGKTINNIHILPVFIDLTEMYGAGNEPTLEQFKADFNLDYYAPSAARLLNCTLNGFRVSDKHQTWSDDFALPLSSVFPNGLCRVGNVVDEIVSATSAKQRIEMRAYQSGDESDTSVLTDGTNTLYVLSAEVTKTITPALNMQVEAENGGTEMILPINTDTPSTAPATMTIRYKV